MYPIHSSQERFEREYGYPEGVSVKNIPYNGNPFSAYTILTKGNKSISVQFGTGGYYPDIAYSHIKTTFRCK